jgi:poly(beta-D-mannuronate) lyase
LLAVVAAVFAAGLGGCATTDEDRGTVTAAPAWTGVPVRPLKRTAAPEQNFNLVHWKLTLPSGDEIQADELNDGFARAGVFFTDPRGGGMVFRCPNLAGSTKHSKYSRTELREMRAGSESAKADENNWTPEEGGTLSARLSVDHVSTTGDEEKLGRVVIGQIHGPDAEVVRLYYTKLPDEEKGRIYAGLDSFKNKTTWSPDIVPNTDGGGIALGEVFGYQIRLSGRQLTVIVQPPSGGALVYSKAVDPAYLGKNVYFKAGVYNQNNTGNEGDYVQATYYALERTHP